MLQISYPFSRLTLEPRPLRASQIWTIAAEVRRQILRGRRRLVVEASQLVNASHSLHINGAALTTHWDLQRAFGEAHASEPLGVTEVDPAVPGTLLVSINSMAIAERDYLLRSTVAHELGHAVFDGPWMVSRACEQALASPDEAHLTTESEKDKGFDWREFRANEFMGALLTPRPLLHRELVKYAIANRLPLYENGEDLPIAQLSNGLTTECLLFDLAERFGVSPDFIEYRLRRYALFT